MEIQIRLKELLQKIGKDERGIAQRIADEIQVHRHTVSRIYHNKLQNPPLDVLARICDWLLANGAEAGTLPQALFGAGSTELWRAVALRTVTIYLSRYKRGDGGTSDWISQRDSAVETEFVRYLSIPENCGKACPTLLTEYVPFRADPAASHITPQEFAAVRDKAIKTLEKMQEQLASSNVILIGSQRSNVLVECMVADLFGCEPFNPSDKSSVPFHITFPTRGWQVRSCFGGMENPTGSGSPTPGTHFLTDRDVWQLCPWKEHASDSGVVITCYHQGNTSVQLAVLGLTGRATQTLGRYLTRNSKDFWPPYASSRHGDVGLYVCEFEFANPSTEDADDTAVRKMNVVPLKKEILEKHLKR